MNGTEMREDTGGIHMKSLSSLLTVISHCLLQRRIAETEREERKGEESRANYLMTEKKVLEAEIFFNVALTNE